MSARVRLPAERALTEKPPTNECWWPAFTAWESFAVEGARRGSAATRTRTSTGCTATSIGCRCSRWRNLNDALVTKGESGPRVAELQAAHEQRRAARRRHRSRRGAERPVSAVVLEFERPLDGDRARARSSRSGAPAAERRRRWCAGSSPRERTDAGATRRKTRWRWRRSSTTTASTRAQVPDFTAAVTLGAEDLVRATFKGRTTEAATTDVPMATLMRTGAGTRDLTAAPRRRGHAVLRDASDATRQTRPIFELDRQRLPHRAPVCAARGQQSRAAATSFKAGDLVRVTLTIDSDEGAALRRRHRSAARGLRAGRVVVRDDGVGRGEGDGSGGRRRAELGRHGGSAAAFDHVERHDDRVHLFATRLSSTAITSSRTSSARRRPARSRPRRRAWRRCTSRRCSAGRRRRRSRSKR